MTFRKGDTLVVSPQDDNDPQSIARAGESCTFQKYYHSPHGTTYVCVTFAQQRVPWVFRQTDVKPIEQQEVAS